MNVTIVQSTHLVIMTFDSVLSTVLPFSTTLLPTPSHTDERSTLHETNAITQTTLTSISLKTTSSTELSPEVLPNNSNGELVTLYLNLTYTTVSKNVGVGMDWWVANILEKFCPSSKNGVEQACVSMTFPATMKTSQYSELSSQSQLRFVIEMVWRANEEFKFKNRYINFYKFEIFAIKAAQKQRK